MNPRTYRIPVYAGSSLEGLDIAGARLSEDGRYIEIESALTEAEARKMLSERGIVLRDRRTRTFRCSIDCANCAAKVEKAIRGEELVLDADFDFSRGTLKVTSYLTDDEIKAIARDAEDEIAFLDEGRTLRIPCSVDCAECARKITDALLGNSSVSSAEIDIAKGMLTVVTSLSERQVKEIARKADDDVSFGDSENSEKRETLSAVIRIASSIILFALSFILRKPLIAVAAYIAAGYDVIWKAIRNIARGKVFDENFLMAVATIGALVISSYEEAAGVMIFYQIGELFQHLAVGRSRKSITGLMDLSSSSCTVIRDGIEYQVSPEDVEIGETVVIRPGEKVAIDAVVIEGSSEMDMKALTGESVPVRKDAGDEILSGSINADGVLKARTVKAYSDSTAARIMKLTEESERKKAKSERFITSFSKVYTPCVTSAALLFAILPPLFGLMSFRDSLYRAMMLLVISCPCALVLSVPLTYFAAMGAFASRGILSKNDLAIQKAARIRTLALDKTGTLTEGRFSISRVDIYPPFDRKTAIEYAAALERQSTHPIAKAICQASEGLYSSSNAKAIQGIGVEGTVDNHLVKAGNKRILGDEEEEESGAFSVVYLTVDGVKAARFLISDTIKSGCRESIARLRKLGVKRIFMLTGDRKEAADAVASSLDLDGALSELLPADKLSAFEGLMEEGTVTAFAGDGINDAPTLARSDLGIAMGGVGSDSAIEAADIVIMDDSIERIAVAIELARKCGRIVKENIAFSLLVKAVVFLLAILGISNMWIAVIADTGVSLIAVANSMRMLVSGNGRQ